MEFRSRLPLATAPSLLAMICSSGLCFFGSLTLYYAGGTWGVQPPGLIF